VESLFPISFLDLLHHLPGFSIQLPVFIHHEDVIGFLQDFLVPAITVVKPDFPSVALRQLQAVIIGWEVKKLIELPPLEKVFADARLYGELREEMAKRNMIIREYSLS